MMDNRLYQDVVLIFFPPSFITLNGPRIKRRSRILERWLESLTLIACETPVSFSPWARVSIWAFNARVETAFVFFPNFPREER